MANQTLGILSTRELFIKMYETEVAMWDDDGEPGDERMTELEQLSHDIATETERRFGDGAVDCLAQHVVRSKASMRDMLACAQEPNGEIILERIACGQEA